jgi:hypothetical protein
MDEKIITSLIYDIYEKESELHDEANKIAEEAYRLNSVVAAKRQSLRVDGKYKELRAAVYGHLETIFKDDYNFMYDLDASLNCQNVERFRVCYSSPNETYLAKPALSKKYHAENLQIRDSLYKIIDNLNDADPTMVKMFKKSLNRYVLQKVKEEICSAHPPPMISNLSSSSNAKASKDFVGGSRNRRSKRTAKKYTASKYTTPKKQLSVHSNISPKVVLNRVQSKSWSVYAWASKNKFRRVLCTLQNGTIKAEEYAESKIDDESPASNTGNFVSDQEGYETDISFADSDIDGDDTFETFTNDSFQYSDSMDCHVIAVIHAFLHMKVGTFLLQL